MVLLDDSKMQQFIVNGYMTVHAYFLEAFHRSVHQQAEGISSSQATPAIMSFPRFPN